MTRTNYCNSRMILHEHSPVEKNINVAQKLVSSKVILPQEISTKVVYNDSYLIIDPAINITATGDATFNNCTLEIENIHNDGDFSGIRVFNGGKLSFKNSTIIASNATGLIPPGDILFEIGSGGIIESSSFNPKTNDGYGPKLHIQTSNLVVSDSYFRKAELNVHGTYNIIRDSVFNYTRILVTGQIENLFESRTRITNNTIFKNGIRLFYSKGNILEKNRLISAIIYLEIADNNTIAHNSISQGTHDETSGIDIFASNENMVIRNNISFNEGYGMTVEAFSKLNTIQYNTIHNNFQHGIVLKQAEKTVIKDNIIFYNGKGPYSISNSENTVFTNNTDNFGNIIPYAGESSLLPLLVLACSGGVILLAASSVFIVKKRRNKAKHQKDQ
ncbi:MAG: nitrous oxide reductase family maturation protein NosD [Candidatus Odinarchaeota archaeon]